MNLAAGGARSPRRATPHERASGMRSATSSEHGSRSDCQEHARLLREGAMHSKLEHAAACGAIRGAEIVAHAHRASKRNPTIAVVAANVYVDLRSHATRTRRRA